MGERERNEETTRRVLDAFDQRDVATVQDLMHPDIEWHVPGRNPLSGDYSGLGDVLSYLAKAFAMSADTVHFDVHAVMADDEHAVALLFLRGERLGLTLNDQTAFVVHFDDGKIREVWFHAHDRHAVDAFWNA